VGICAIVDVDLAKLTSPRGRRWRIQVNAPPSPILVSRRFGLGDNERCLRVEANVLFNKQDIREFV
jgi:hypothetical protein